MESLAARLADSDPASLLRDLNGAVATPQARLYLCCEPAGCGFVRTCQCPNIMLARLVKTAFSVRSKQSPEHHSTRTTAQELMRPSPWWLCKEPALSSGDMARREFATKGHGAHDALHGGRCCGTAACERSCWKR